MDSKPKKRKVPKVSSAIPDHPESHKPQDPKVLIRQNGELIEGLLCSEAWREIVFPVLEEMKAGVSGRFTNGRYWHGTLTSEWSGNTSVFVAGYQKGLMDFYNKIHDFVLAKNKIDEDAKRDAQESKAPIINPFMEEDRNYETD